MPDKNEKNENSFFKWLMHTQLINEKGEVWILLFKNIIAIIMVVTFVILCLKQYKIPQEFNLLLGLITGFYFGNNTKKQ